MHEKYLETIVSKGSKEDMEDLEVVFNKAMEFIEDKDEEMYEKLEMKMYRIVYGDKLTLEKAEEIVKDMKPYGEHWTYEQTTDVLKTKGISNIDPVDFYAIMNMSYNDYHDMFDEDIDKYVEYTKLFIDDEDAKEGKVFIYLTTIPKE